MKVRRNEVHVKEFLLLLGSVREEVFVVCHGLPEANSNTILDDIDQVVVCHLGINIKSIDIVHLFLDSNCLLEITYLVKSPVWLILVAIILPNSILDLFPSI